MGCPEILQHGLNLLTVCMSTGYYHQQKFSRHMAFAGALFFFVSTVFIFVNTVFIFVNTAVVFTRHFFSFRTSPFVYSYRTFTTALCTLLFASAAFAGNDDKQQLLDKVWQYRNTRATDTTGNTQNVYMRNQLSVDRRNFTLWFVPHLYPIAHGSRQYLNETYGKIRFTDSQHFDWHRQVTSGTLPRSHRVMRTALQYVTPTPYNNTLYGDQLLSPFHRKNRRFYRYNVTPASENWALLTFRPRASNTQLVQGRALVDTNTGRLHYITFDGDFDMLGFKVNAIMNSDDTALIPQLCQTTAKFNFLGNRIATDIYAVYDCETTLPDSINEIQSAELIDSLRPTPLSPNDIAIYEQKAARHAATDSITADSTRLWRLNRLKDIAWNVIGDNLLSPLQAKNDVASVRLSPLFNPLYMNYSPSRGLSYRLNIGACYKWSDRCFLTFNPRLGYNFKIEQLYITAPLRMTYNPERRGFVDVIAANGNRIASTSVATEVRKELGARADSLTGTDLYFFKDASLSVANNIMLNEWMQLRSGVVYHHRTSMHKRTMRLVGKPTAYNSFAPVLNVRLSPWGDGPILNIDYERSIKGILKSSLEYERWEIDASYKHRMPCLRVLSMRLGTGFYTNKKTNYFIDFSHFYQENIPGGWNDDWTGQFQLLNPGWYNESNYYARLNTTYESPLLWLSWLPVAGRYVETERLYLSALSIDKTRPYAEVGYGFSSRFISVGFFASFLSTHLQDYGCKLTLELFDKW